MCRAKIESTQFGLGLGIEFEVSRVVFVDLGVRPRLAHELVTVLQQLLKNGNLELDVLEMVMENE